MVAAKGEGVVAGTEVADAKTEGVVAKTEGVVARTEVVVARTEVADAKIEVVVPRTEMADAMDEVADAIISSDCPPRPSLSDRLARDGGGSGRRLPFSFGRSRRPRNL